MNSGRRHFVKGKIDLNNRLLVLLKDATAGQSDLIVQRNDAARPNRESEYAVHILGQAKGDPFCKGSPF